MADSEADEIFGCIFFFLGVIVVGSLAVSFFVYIVSPVVEGDAPTWKIWFFMIGVSSIGLIVGLGKAFEAGFSSMTLLNFFGKRREQEDKKSSGSDD